MSKAALTRPAAGTPPSTGAEDPEGRRSPGAATLIAGESEDELVAFGKRLRANVAPVGELELMLAHGLPR
jgi:hypothetical protein